MLRLSDWCADPATTRPCYYTNANGNADSTDSNPDTNTNPVSADGGSRDMQHGCVQGCV